MYLFHCCMCIFIITVMTFIYSPNMNSYQLHGSTVKSPNMPYWQVSALKDSVPTIASKQHPKLWCHVDIALQSNCASIVMFQSMFKMVPFAVLTDIIFKRMLLFCTLSRVYTVWLYLISVLSTNFLKEIPHFKQSLFVSVKWVKVCVFVIDCKVL